MRAAFYSLINQIIRDEPDCVYMTVDIGMWAVRDLLANYPKRAMNFGIYEDGMFGVAAGLAAKGLIPIIYGIQPFLILRALEQIKMDFAYQKLGVNVVGTGAAVDYSKYGYSHYCAEDAGLIKSIPGAEFIAPGTSKEFAQLFKQTYRNGYPTFFRISDHPNCEYDCDVTFGKAAVLQKGGKATVIAVSVLLDTVMEACRGLDVTVLYYTTLEPFDKETLRECCENGKVLVCEPHFKGTLDADILEALEGIRVLIYHRGLPREIFRNYGSYAEKKEYYKLTAEHIKETLQRLISAE